MHACRASRWKGLLCYNIRQVLYSIYTYKKRKFFHEVFFGWVSVERSGGFFVPCVRLCCCWRKDKFFINATPAIFCAIPSSYTSASMFPSSSPTKHSYFSEEYCCFWSFSAWNVPSIPEHFSDYFPYRMKTLFVERLQSHVHICFEIYKDIVARAVRWRNG